MKYLLVILIILFSFQSLSNEKKKGFSTLPGWSAGYRYDLDLDEDEKSKLRLFGKYKQKSGSTIKFGWDKQVGRTKEIFSLVARKGRFTYRYKIHLFTHLQKN